MCTVIPTLGQLRERDCELAASLGALKILAKKERKHK